MPVISSYPLQSRSEQVAQSETAKSETAKLEGSHVQTLAALYVKSTVSAH